MDPLDPAAATILMHMLFVGALVAPYSTGIFETIVAVHFKSGLAVEFFDGGGYVVSNSGVPDFSKAIISFWFRVPRATLQAAYNSWVQPTSTSRPLFNGVTPLVIFGDNTIKGYAIDGGTTIVGSKTAEVWTQQVTDPVGTYELRDGLSSTINENIDFYQPGVDLPREPCFIGIDSNRQEIEDYDPGSGDPPPSPNVLVVNIQMSSKSSASGMIPSRTSETFSGDQIRLEIGGTPGAGRSGGPILHYGPDFFGNSTFYIDGFNPFVTTDVYVDNTSVFTESNTESFTIKLDSHEIIPDHWHIVTLSFDISGAVTSVGIQMPSPLANPFDVPDHGSISSSCKGWIAVDDVNYKGAAIRDKLLFDDYTTSRLSFDPNGLYTPNAIAVALTRTAANGSTGELAGAGYTFENINSGLSEPAYNYAPGNIRAAGYPIGLPATADYASKIRNVEMGEFKMWVGKTLNTANTNARRLFVDSKGKPVNPKVAAKVLGKPTVLFHGSDNWIKGKNTGTSGLFDPTLPIERYLPDPSLHGPQSPKK